jgi:hypothetical protein
MSRDTRRVETPKRQGCDKCKVPFAEVVIHDPPLLGELDDEKLKPTCLLLCQT